MLIGLGIEYGIQVVLRYQEELRSGASGMEAIETGLSANIRSIIMAAATVALAFATFAFTDFKGIAELGIIAAGGVFICVMATFTVLPAMLILLERFRKSGHSDAPVKRFQSAEHPILRAPVWQPAGGDRRNAAAVAGLRLSRRYRCVSTTT